MIKIKNIVYRRILNSHVDFTNEFIVELEDGGWGIGAAPQGETISIYEDKTNTVDPARIVETIKRDNYCNIMVNQEKFDEYLQQNMSLFGRNNTYALSLAFFNARSRSQTFLHAFHKPETKLTAPAICLNILNGGNHAYTNPVLSDFHEYLLVAKSNDIEEIIRDHKSIQDTVKAKLSNHSKTVVSGNPVNSFATADNRECIEFLLNIRDNLGLTDKYDLMIDASGGDLWTEQGYCLALTDNSVRNSEQFCTYWTDMIQDYHLKFLEDPFHEKDYESWRQLTTTQDQCHIIGDNFYSSDAQRIQEGAAKKYTHGVIIKPNQAGTVSSVILAIEAAQSHNQIVVTSHRSISTESTFLAMLTCMYNVKYIKIGPLYTDYSSVVRLNEIIRLTEECHG